MKIKRILAAVLSLMMLPAVPGVYAEELFSETYDMTAVKPDGENGIVFEQEVPDGDYTVTVKTGGDTETKANVYINGGERVRAYTLEAGQTQDNEQPVVPKDGKITVQVLGETPNVTEIDIVQLPDRTTPGEKTTVYIAGDSTAQTYDYTKVYPQTGWGQVFADCFTDDIIVENRSMGGRSLKSYNNDGRLDRILTEMHPGDYVFIQFGINDGAENKPERYISVPDYKELMKTKYIAEVQKRGGTPVVLTATAASWWDEEKQEFMESRQDYAVPTKEVAEETGVTLLDVNKAMTEKWNTMEKEDVFDLYFICEPLESKAYPTGTDDHTHIKQAGAKAIAGMVAEIAAEQIPFFAEHLNPEEVFTDIAGHWAQDAIKALGASVLDGYGDGTFRPDDTVTRAEFLKMAMDAANIPGHAYRDLSQFGVSEEDWYCYYLQSALDKGLIPAEMIWSSGMEETNEVLAEATEDKEAVTEKVMKYMPLETSSSGRMPFDGDKPITRAEMAAIASACVLLNPTEEQSAAIEREDLKDSVPFSDTSASSAAYAYALGLVNGVEGTEYGAIRFMPDANLTRAEAVVVAQRIMAVVK